MQGKDKSNDVYQLTKELITELLQETEDLEALRFVYAYLWGRKQKFQKVKEEVG